MMEAPCPLCVHCGSPMVRWATPQASSWGGQIQFVCFNDSCPYFVGGWAWMESRFSVAASYRYRLDPVTGERGPLAVWSPTACRDGIVEDPEETHAG